MTTASIPAYIDANRDRFLDELKALIAIPSISTLPEHQDDLRRAASYLVDQIKQAGLENAQLIETVGHPLVYADWLSAPGKPTVLIYGHYDVQPVDPIELWRTPPFSPTVIGENLYGRGAVDDKGQMFATIKALEVLIATNGALPVNVRVLIEGEEEHGGESIATYVQENPDKLAADCALILDTGMVGKGIPTLTYALRGIVYAEIEARGAGHDLHSGMYGGIAPNPIQALAWVLADLKSRDGMINIPGLYTAVRPLTEQERETLQRQSAAAAERLMAAAELSALPGENDYSVMERSTARPTLEVHGIHGGFTAEGAKTVIPAMATAKVSMRLVANQRPTAVFDLFKQRVLALAPDGITLDVREIHSGDAVETPLDAPVMQDAAAALEAEFGHAVEFERSGGSIPIAALFGSVLRLPVVMMGFGLADDNVHAPNEKFYIPNYYAAIRSVAGFLQRLGA